MPSLWVTEFKHVGKDHALRQTLFATLPPNTEQVLTISGVSAQSAGFQGGTHLIRIHTDTACHVSVGQNPTATSSNMRLAANSTEYIAVDPNDKIAVIQS